MSSGIVESNSQNQGSGADQQPNAQGNSRSRLVQRLLSAAPNLPAFMNDLLTTQAVVVAGTEAAGFLVEKQENGQQLRPVAHIRPDQAPQETRSAAISAFQEIVRPCVNEGKDGAIEINNPGDTAEPQFCLVTLLRNEGSVVAVAAVITRCRNLERAQQRLMSMQLVAGYFDLFTLKRGIEQTQIIAQSHQHVLQLASSVATAEGFEGAAMNLCNELANRTSATRVALGWMRSNTIKVKALSHTEQFDKKQDVIVQLEKVMEECIDQEEPVQFEPDGAGTDNVKRAAQALSNSQGGNGVLSLPLRQRGEIVGAVTLEFAPGQKISPQAATGLGVAVDLLAPQLYDRFQNDRWLITKTGLSIQNTAKLAIGPKHMLAKVLILACLVLIPFISLYPFPHRISASFELAPIEKRSLCAPFEGRIHEVFVRPGAEVTKGQKLLSLDTRELIPKRAEAMSRANAKRAEMEKYRAEGKTADLRIAQAEADASQAEADLYAYQIERATVVSPLDGILLKGDLQDKKDAPVKQGDVLMEVAPRGQLQAELAVNERDVQFLKEGQKGWIATTAMPSDQFAMKVDRIVPLGQPKDQNNVFKVYATIDPLKPNDPLYDRPPQWRPGMEGEARIAVGERSLLWIYGHRLVDFLRLKLWM